jgi:hypothetical protein
MIHSPYNNTVNNVSVERDCTCTANQAWGLSRSCWRGKYRQARGKELIGVVKYCTVGKPVIRSRHYMIGYLTQWTSCFRRGSAAAHLRVRISLGAWICVPVASVVYFQVEVSASGWSLVERAVTECGVSEYDREAPIMTKPWPTTDCCAIKKKHDRMIELWSNG